MKENNEKTGEFWDWLMDTLPKMEEAPSAPLGKKIADTRFEEGKKSLNAARSAKYNL